MRSATIATILIAFASTASAEHKLGQVSINGRFGYHLSGTKGVAAGTASTHLLFLNPCTGGCSLTQGNTDNRSDTSDISSGNTNLSQFSQSSAVWSSVMSCMRNTFSRFNVTITDVDPGSSPHMEVMVAGIATELMGSQGEGVGGIADFPCSGVGQCDPFMENALVFAFANDPYYSNNPDEICSTAAQEIAHTWALDHVVDASDPMTYNQFSGIRQYNDNEVCGSDCQSGQSPFGLSCTGSGGQATHTCTGTGNSTQNEVTMILALFGSSTPDNTPPTVSITSPATGASVQAGFMVTANITDNVDIASAELKLDGTSVKKISGSPWTWTTPSSLAHGSHHIDVIATDGSGNSATASADVVYGAACKKSSDCTTAGDICDNGYCVPGPTATGGLGSTCTSNEMCASGQCANDGAGHSYCVEGCSPTASMCPGGFECLATGASGVCWPNGDTTGGGGGGGGGCNTSGSGGATLFAAGALAALLVTRRRARA